MKSRVLFNIGVMCLLLGQVCQAAIIIPGADGSDGVFNPTSNVEIDLTQAANAAWDTASPVAGKGVYDGEKWAVVFKYSEVNIPAGVTVTFKNSSSNAPVVWLVSGNVTISGTVSLTGSSGAGYNITASGPGGFRGGTPGTAARNAMCGLGPGGGEYGISDWAGNFNGWGAGYATLGAGNSGATVYGTSSIIPILGGSGGAGSYDYSGGGGGGAILIACAQTLSINGALNANGGGGGRGGPGSGGAIRIIADTYTIGGTVYAIAGPANYWYSGGVGRIRIEAAHGYGSEKCSPAASCGAPASPAQIWPANIAPTVRIAQVVAGSNVVNFPADPKAGLDFPNQDAAQTSTQMTTLRMEAANVPLDWIVKVRVGPLNNAATWITATRVSGDATASVWEAQFTPPAGFCALQARAYKP